MKIKLRKIKMHKLKSKTMSILIAAIMILAIGASTNLTSLTSAHTPPQSLPLIAFINVSPDPCGLGQAITIDFWLNSPPATANGPYGDRYTGFMINVVPPSGANVTLGPFTSDDTGGTNTRFTPTQTGTYSFQMTFPGEVLTGSTGNSLILGSTNPYVNDTILPAMSHVATVTVQQTPVPTIPNSPLPTNYWQTPVNTMNVVNWYSITVVWLGTGRNANPIGAEMYNFSSNYNPYTTAPLTAHIMWTKPEAFGGAILEDPSQVSTTYGDYYSVSQYATQI